MVPAWEITAVRNVRDAKVVDVDELPDGGIVLFLDDADYDLTKAEPRAALMLCAMNAAENHSLKAKGLSSRLAIAT